MKKKKIIAEFSNPSILVVDGKKYILEKETHKVVDKIPHLNQAIFEEFNEEEYKEDLDLIVNRLAEYTDARELLRELIKTTPYKEIRKMARNKRNKEQITNTTGCLGFKIGKGYLPLID